ncbi:MAG: hypothetical protein K6G43_05465 [Lachnospiraceae bacterium]|jgi:predicted PurR-regulated permease PerM|nr:hypothetical protein [Lachnospiraceae bacterium]
MSESESLNDNVSSKYEKRGYITRLVIAACSVLTFLTLLIVVIIVVPKAVNLMNTAQRTLDNIEDVSENLKALELAETVKSIDDSTVQAMGDVSEAMDRINELDIASLNESIQELKESTERFSSILNP